MVVESCRCCSEPNYSTFFFVLCPDVTVIVLVGKLVVLGGTWNECAVIKALEVITYIVPRMFRNVGNRIAMARSSIIQLDDLLSWPFTL